MSSFGIGGTNAHVVLEEIERSDDASAPRDGAPTLLRLSARTDRALGRAARELADWVERERPSLSDVAATLESGRHEFAVRSAASCGSREDAVRALRAVARRPAAPPALARIRTCFLFPGQGTQGKAMAAGLYGEAASFTRALDRSTAILTRELGFDVLALLLEPDAGASLATDTARAQAVLFAFEHAIDAELGSLGLRPAFAIGHSVGEIAALCAAGALATEDAARLVALRGRAMQRTGPGRMIAAALDLATAHALAGDGVSIAAENAERSVVFSGESAAIDELARTLAALGIRHRPLQDRFAFHSALMDPILDDFEREAAGIVARPTAAQVVSNLHAVPFADGVPCGAAYWRAHVRGMVRYRACVERVLAAGEPVVFIEVGAGATLTRLARDIAATSGGAECRFVRTDSGETGRAVVPRDVHAAVAAAWEAGADVAPTASGRRVSLPGYSFEKVRCWPDVPAATAAGDSAPRATHPALAVPRRPRAALEARIARAFAEQLGVPSVGADDDYFELGGDSLSALALFARLERELGLRIAADTLAAYRSPAELAAHLGDSGALAADPADPRARGEGAGAGAPPRPAASRPDLVVPLGRSESDRAPLFAIHPAGGSVFCYRSIAARVARERGFFAVRPPAECASADRVDTIEGLARRYVAAVRTSASGKPFLLGGYSFGGNVAFEMALQLQRAGEHVPVLVMFDTHPPASYAGPMPDDAAYDAVLPELACLALGIDYEALAPAARTLAGVQQMLGTNATAGGPFPWEDTAGFVDVWKNNHRALKLHKPAGLFAGRIVYFQAEEPQPPSIAKIHIRVEPGMAEVEWGKLCTGSLTVIRTPGNHYNLLAERNAAFIASALADELREARLG